MLLRYRDDSDSVTSSISASPSKKGKPKRFHATCGPGSSILSGRLGDHSSKNKSTKERKSRRYSADCQGKTATQGVHGEEEQQYKELDNIRKIYYTEVQRDRPTLSESVSVDQISRTGVTFGSGTLRAQSYPHVFIIKSVFLIIMNFLNCSFA